MTAGVDKYVLLSKGVKDRFNWHGEFHGEAMLQAINHGLEKHFGGQSIVRYDTTKTLIDLHMTPVWIETYLGFHYMYIHDEAMSHPLSTTFVKLIEREDGIFQFPPEAVLASDKM